ncbi:MAG: lysostaphin resistance A-like protein [Candidatus Hodarchaeota archaeon]
MGYFRKIRDPIFLPIFIVTSVLSIELISASILEMVVRGLEINDTIFFLSSNKSIDYLIQVITRGVGLLVVIFIGKRIFLQDTGLKEIDEKLPIFLITSIFLFIGLIDILKDVFQGIFSLGGDIKLWPELAISGVIFDDLGNLLLLSLLLLVLTPVFEELLYRRIIIYSLKKNQIGNGWLILVSSLIYTLPQTLLNLIECSEGQALWDFFLKFFIGVVLAVVFLRTNQIKYPIIMKSLLNLTFFIDYLIMLHPILSQFKELMTLLLFILNLIGIFLFFVVIFDGAASLRESPSNLPIWLGYITDYRFSENSKLQTLLGISIIFLPIIPMGLVLFIDHTIIYNDLGGVLARTAFKLPSLSLLAFASFMGIKSNRSLNEEAREPNLVLKPILADYYLKTRKNFRTLIREIPRLTFSHFSLILLFVGAVVPLFIFSMSATGSIQIAFIWVETKVDYKLGQSPFFSYSWIYTETKSSISFLGEKTTEEYLYFLKHNNGKWYFLPDTFMSHPGDWIHGLITVGSWFLFLILLAVTVREYANNRKLNAAVAILGVIITDFLWLQFAFGLGSIPAEGELDQSLLTQTLLQFIETDFKVQNFLLLPIGLIILLIAIIILLTIWIRQKRKDKREFAQVISNKKEDSITKA